MIIRRKLKKLEEKSGLVPLIPPQVLHQVSRDRTPGSTVKSEKPGDSTSYLFSI
jgi:hypothetical protein